MSYKRPASIALLSRSSYTRWVNRKIDCSPYMFGSCRRDFFSKNEPTRRTIKSILLQAGFSEEEIEKLTVAQLTFWLNCRRLNQTGNKKETVGKVSDVIFLDFSKALDSVPNKRLLLKLNRNGIDGQLYLWFRIFF